MGKTGYEIQETAATWVPDEMVQCAQAAYKETSRQGKAGPGSREAMRQALMAGFLFSQRFTVWMGAGLTADQATARAVAEITGEEPS